MDRELCASFRALLCGSTLLLITLGTASAVRALPFPDAAAPAAPAAPAVPGAKGAPTVKEAEQFVAAAEERLRVLSVDSQRTGWVQETYITSDTEILSAQSNEKLIAAGVELAKEASRWNGVSLPAELRRKLELIKGGLTLAAPSDPQKTAELARLVAALDSQYGAGKYCPDGPNGKCLDFDALEDTMEHSRDPKALLDAWKGWHTISP
ncbi:MAG TPA: M2 family metallopeptidase, partial [Thermoanaerobaculia bacterium]|nr:M2 family metallopeptidase [Thermoanaerobaculia bacterium]